MDGVDAGYLYLETPAMHMHTLKIAIVDPAQPFEFDRLVAELEARLEQLPPLRRRALPAPFRLHHPLWVVDRPVDPTQHVFRHPVPEPGGMRGLEELIGRVAGTPLDRSRPLWEMHVCQPFDDGRVAIVTKMHHALADGVAANALLAGLVDGSAGSGPGDGVHLARENPPALALDPTPGWFAQLGSALLAAVVQMVSLPGLLARTASAVLSVVQHKRGSTVEVPRPVLDAPRVRFNASLTPRRNFATCTLPVADLKRVQRAHGVTLNDVVLAVVGGALREWLGSCGELPSDSLVAGVPVATDAPGAAPRLGGNRVSNLFTSLATDHADPRERLLEIARVAGEAKQVQRTLGPDMLVDWVQFAPPAPLSAVMWLYSRSGAASHHSPPFNLVVSNVRGPGEEVSIAGARLCDLFSVGPILEGMGLNITAWSYVGRMNFSLLSCPDLVPDLSPLVAALPRALAELLATVDLPPGATEAS